MGTTWLISVAAMFLVGGEPAASDKPAPTVPPQSIFESPERPTAVTPIDRLVFAKLKSLGIEPVRCSDAVFVRRAYLDVIGTLPTADEAREFIQDASKDKRRQLIDRLLARDEFADYWAMKWGDILRIKAEFPVNLWPNAAQAYHRWVRASIAENKPYDKFVRELITASGSNFRVGPVNFYRALQNRTPEGTATGVALTFMGARVDGWPKDRLEGMSVFFAQIGYKPTREWKEEHVFWQPLKEAEPPKTEPAKTEPVKTEPPKKEPPKPEPSKTSGGKGKSGKKAFTPPAPPPPPPLVFEPPPAPVLVAPPLDAVFPDGTKIHLPANRDPREVFADWLITPKNPWFTRNIANRVWSWLLGRGIIHEPDDIRDDNPPSNPELLAYLEKELIDSHYNVKHLYRLILNSETYQLSSLPGPKTVQAEAQFARYGLRRLDAEVLIDAINRITGTSDLYTSPIPEPFTYIPADKPAIAIADGSITSPFLTLFGRSARATGLENERNNKPVSAQWLHLLNSSHIQRKLAQGPKLKALFASDRKPAAIVEELYLTVLSRQPTPEEVKTAVEYNKPDWVTKAEVEYVRAKAAAEAAKAKAAADAARAAAEKAAAKSGTGKTGVGKSGAGKTGAGKTGAVKPAYVPKPPKIPPKPVQDWVDITWALINSPEFLYRH